MCSLMKMQNYKRMFSMLNGVNKINMFRMLAQLTHYMQHDNVDERLLWDGHKWNLQLKDLIETGYFCCQIGVVNVERENFSACADCFSLACSSSPSSSGFWVPGPLPLPPVLVVGGVWGHKGRWDEVRLLRILMAILKRRRRSIFLIVVEIYQSDTTPSVKCKE